jgi:hypothetical protein
MKQIIATLFNHADCIQKSLSIAPSGITIIDKDKRPEPEKIDLEKFKRKLE